MISLQNLSKSYGAQELFEGVTLQMQRGERLGLIGRNGYGKSTLFRILLGEEEPDSGKVVFPRNYRLGHLAQHLHFTGDTVRDEACLGLPPGEEHNAYKAEKILFGLGFDENDLYRAPSEFSGGFQIRINLAKLLVSDPDLLLLDEPTNYLDIVSIRWVKQFLRNWKKELILISHDRDFMDSVTSHTAVIHRQKIRKQEGKTEALLNQIALEEETLERTRLNEDKQRKHLENFISRFQANAATASRAQSRMKMLEKMPERDRLAFIQSLDFSFNAAPIAAKNLLKAEGVTFGYDEGDPLIRDFSMRVTVGDRIGIIGRNGRGKSTLLNLLAGELKPNAGEVKTHPETRIGFFGQTNIDRLHPKMTVEGEIGSVDPTLGYTAIRNICGTMMFGGDLAKKSVGVLSGGERSRVLLGKILAMPTNLLLLDEPTNHLDMPSIDALVESLKYFEGAVLIVTHSERILKSLANRLVIFQGGGVRVFEGGYDDFLREVGWEEEEGSAKAPSKTIAESIAGKKETRKKRADLVSERSKLLAPLKKEMTDLEKEIVKLEEEIKRANDELLAASRDKNVGAFVPLSKKVKDAQKSVERKFARLEEVTLKHDRTHQEFEALLKDAE